MKKLYLIRHAKSSWKDISLDDFDRPLNKRGKLNAPMMGERLFQRGVNPDLILSSPAKRALKTAKIIAKHLQYQNEIEFNEDIYEASEDTLHKIICNIDDGNDTVILIGHNPGFNCLAYEYVDFDENIPTCGVVEINFNCKKWKEISVKNASFVSFDYPKKS